MVKRFPKEIFEISEELWMKAFKNETPNSDDLSSILFSEMEKSWGLLFKSRYAGRDCMDTFCYYIIDKDKLFLAKIKHGF